MVVHSLHNFETNMRGHSMHHMFAVCVLWRLVKPPTTLPPSNAHVYDHNVSLNRVHLRQARSALGPQIPNITQPPR